MKKFLPALLFVAACEGAPPELTTAPFQPDSGNLFVRCGALIDGLSDEVQHDRTVVVQDGRIAMIVDGDAEVRPNMTFLDLSDKTCLPGLINTHVHLAVKPEDAVDYSIYYTSSAEQHTQVALDFAATNLLSGFTTVRNVGEFFPEAITSARQRIRDGESIGPRIRHGGPYMTIPKGGGTLWVPYLEEDDIPPESELGMARGADEFRARAEAAVAKGYDHLKVIASGAVFSFSTEPGSPEMTQDEIAAVVEVERLAAFVVARREVGVALGVRVLQPVVLEHVRLEARIRALAEGR